MRVAQKWLVVLAAVGTLFFLAAPAVADWDPENPADLARAKWIQLPDLTPLGMDVKATLPKILADDWECRDPRPVTDIHFWGSFKYDVFSDEMPLITVQIWSDQPADPTQDPPYSRPKDFLWQPSVFTMTARPYYESPDGEGWYDPNTGEYIPFCDYVVWQLNLDVSQDPFHQTPGEIYWLVLQAQILDGSYVDIGWKTTDANSHWGDDAVWADGILGQPGTAFQWNELYHPETGESLDFSFVITVPEPGTLALLATAGLGLVFLTWRRRRERR